MTTVSQIISIAFMVASIAGIIYFSCGRTSKTEYKKYYLIASIIYFTGTAIILAVNFVRADIPILFTIIGEIGISIIFIFTEYIIGRLIKNADDIKKEINK